MAVRGYTKADTMMKKAVESHRLASGVQIVTPQLLASDEDSESDSEFDDEKADEQSGLHDYHWLDQVHDIWRCTVCDAELTYEKCPNVHKCPMGHDVNDKCLDYGKECSYAMCLKDGEYCQTCGPEPGKKDEVVAGTVAEGEDMSDAKEEDDMRFDKEDGVWRCVHCQWEVEWDNEGTRTHEDVGICKCMIDEHRPREIDLSKYPNYEPAYCSLGDTGLISGEDVSVSSDSDGYSEDERFIDDEPVPRDDIRFAFTYIRYQGKRVPPSEGSSTNGVSEEEGNDEVASISDESSKSVKIWLLGPQAKTAEDMLSKTEA